MNKEYKKEINLPKIIVGVFIFNEQNELFLMKSIKWQDKYVCPGGAIELNESIKDATRREVKEETNLDIKDIKFITAFEPANLSKAYQSAEKYLFFLAYKAKLKDKSKIKLNKESLTFKWRKIENWLKEKKLEDYTKKIIKEYLLDNNDFENSYKMALADYQNLLKQTAREKQEFAKYAHEDILYKILPIYDNLKIAIRHDNSNDSWLEGVKYVVKQFRDMLSEIGVEEISALGKKFDHNTMEAIEGKGKKVIKELQPGYKLKGKVIIPAKVVVG